MHNYSPAEPLTLATVLLVETNQAQAQALELALLDEPYAVVLASSLVEAQQILSQSGFDVVLVNQRLGGDSASELLAQVHRRYPAAIRILLVDDANTHAARRAVQTGAVHHCLSVPRDEADLALVIYNSLVQRSFLPPESEGVLPSQAPVSSIMPSRAPSSG